MILCSNFTDLFCFNALVFFKYCYMIIIFVVTSCTVICHLLYDARVGLMCGGLRRSCSYHTLYLVCAYINVI